MSRIFIGPKHLKYVSLVLLALQNAILILVMRYATTQPGEMFLKTSSVVMAEVFKCGLSLAVIFYAEAHLSMAKFIQHMNENIVQQPLDCLKIAVPSVIYMLQNNLLYIAVSNLEAATYQVTYQLKILTTALFSVIMLRKVVTRVQWVSLVLLLIGVACVQLQPHDAKASENVATEQKPLVGLLAVITSCLMSGFAGVYFEKILKGTKQSIWLRNFQLGLIGMISGYIAVRVNDGPKLEEKGFFVGFTWVVWVVVMLQSFGGLMVAVVVKYADNILKGFATSAAIIISCIASIYFFDFQLSWQFCTGATLVMVSVYMYSKYAPPPEPPLPSSMKV